MFNVFFSFFFCSVLVHSGGVHGGHYYAFIRPTLSDQWYASCSKRSLLIIVCAFACCVMELKIIMAWFDLGYFSELISLHNDLVQSLLL